ncbi:TetR family transcriptional regulator C-terminal domain-containing protein [Massilia sp. ST3]|uniref:TetR/AcrR family transcriptional regulator n=1 Tax=Massilia sp. ST3 TaxID=2824903 RepID=UPI001B83DABF|nr:TetR/AcrR family transcriptional regulator [Massilia sp. ST3]
MVAARKSESTRAAIIEHALGVASHDGLEALTLGTLADSMKMSKSGVFSRVGSRETLQLAVLANYRQRFEAQVLHPARMTAPGLPRLRRLFDMSLLQVESGKSAGCFYISCAAEYDDRPGPVRHALTSSVTAWRDAFGEAARGAVEQGQLDAATDPEQLVFEIYALLLAAQHDARLLEQTGAATRARAGFERLLARCGAHTERRSSHA